MVLDVHSGLLFTTKFLYLSQIWNLDIKVAGKRVDLRLYFTTEFNLALIRLDDVGIG